MPEKPFNSSRRKALKTGALAGIGTLIAVNGITGGIGSSAFSQPNSKAELFKNLVPQIFVTVSAIGKSKTDIINDGADFGPDTSGTTTSGIQEALKSIASTGGLVYCVNNGTYDIAGSVIATGNNQTLYFEPGCILDLDASGSYNSGGVFYPFSDSSSYNYNGNLWLGNGTEINTNALTSTYTILNCGNVSYGTAGSCTATGLVEGFDIVNLAITGLAMIGANSAGYDPEYYECIRQVTLRHIYISFASSASSSPAGLYIGGSAYQIVVDGCVVDQTGSDLSGADACFIRSQWGNVSHVDFRSCIFIASNSSNTPLEIQGADNASGCTTEFITFEDCEFDNSYNFIDDDYGSSYYAYVNNIEFRRCLFTSTMLFDSAPQNSSLTYGWPLGYVRFVDCDLGDQSWSSFVSSALSNRSPGQSVDISSIFKGASGTTYTNGQLVTGLNSEIQPFDQTILVFGGSAVSISIDGQPSGSSGGPASGSFVLRAGHSITIYFTKAPSVYLCPL